MRAFSRLSTAAGTLYLAGLLGWCAARWYWGDRWWWLFALNVFALYLFLPLVPLVLAAIITRYRPLLATTVLVAALGGITVAPGIPLGLPREVPGGPSITVLTYNLYGIKECVPCAIATIRAANADLVAIQELTPRVAEAIVRDLGTEYPYRVLDPEPGVLGMGTISRFPLRERGETLPGSWFAQPQVLMLDFAGQQVTVLNVHPVATALMAGPAMEESIRSREAQARVIAAFAAAHEGPLLAPGDYNTTNLTAAYAILSGPLRDSWREAGRGPGHTFPGGADYPVNWLLRIDYILHSPHWTAADVRVLGWDESSDHRPLLATLVLSVRE